ncbi:MAG TPA: non-homologous end-joining DNA ligase [Bacillota bacterium]
MPPIDPTVEVAGRRLTLRNLDKPFWPQDGLTKGDLLAYCARVSPWLLPHLRNRPLVMTRYPDGIEGKSFYQKDVPEHAPAWIRLFPYWSRDSNRLIRFVVCDDTATLLWVVNTGAIELHPLLGQIPDPQVPDFAVIDLDPAEGVGYRETVDVAGMLHDLLDYLGLRGYPKTTGATGIHVFVPIEPRYDFRYTADFVRRLGVVLRGQAPERVTLERSVRRRRGRVYVDYLQNALGKTLVSVFCPRPRPGAPVSFPVAWEDLRYVAPGDFTLRNAVDLLQRRGDAFLPVLRDRQRLEVPSQRLDRLLAAAGAQVPAAPSTSEGS